MIKKYILGILMHSYFKKEVIYLHFIPKFLIIFFLFLQIVPWRSNNLTLIFPPLYLSVYYYYCIFNKDEMPLWFAMVAGFMYDVLLLTPLGLGALTNIILRQMVFSQHKLLVKSTFSVLWFMFMLFSLIVILFHVIVFYIKKSYLIPFPLLINYYGLLIISYPLLHKLCSSLKCFFIKDPHYAT